MNKFRKAYLSLESDDARKGFLALHMDAGSHLPDGAYVEWMKGALGDDWVEELERLGLLWPEEEDG